VKRQESLTRFWTKNALVAFGF